MSNGENLLKLQEIDIELNRLQQELAELPELKSLAKKRSALAAAKKELRNVLAQRKDAETDLEELAAEEADYRKQVEDAQNSAGSQSGHQDAQDLSIKLSNLAKWLDKVAFDQREALTRFEELSTRAEKGQAFIEKLEASIIKNGQAARSAAQEIKDAIACNRKQREAIVHAMPETMKAAYDVASKQFRGLGVEVLQGETPSLCRTRLTEASIDEVRRSKDVTTCPYCHRILIVEDGE